MKICGFWKEMSILSKLKKPLKFCIQMEICFDVQIQGFVHKQV